MDDVKFGIPEQIKVSHVPAKNKDESPLIMIVEDNQFVAQFVEEILRQIGANVIVARSGPEAVDLFISAKDSISLVILDYGIPGMHASQLVNRFRTLQSGIKVVISSGYEECEIFSDISRKEIDGFIAKPYEVRPFLNLLSQLLPIVSTSATYSSTTHEGDPL